MAPEGYRACASLTDEEHRWNMAKREAVAGGTWLRILSGLIIVFILVALLYAGTIGLLNFWRITV